MKAQHLEPDAQRACNAARGKVTATLTELAQLHRLLPMPREAFPTQIQRIADEHAQPCGYELLVQQNSDGLIELRIKVQKAKRQCEACKTIECFFHPPTE